MAKTGPGIMVLLDLFHKHGDDDSTNNKLIAFKMLPIGINIGITS
jgi:hypothetical protein